MIPDLSVALDTVQKPPVPTPLQQKAQDLETAFLSEMLTAAGFGKPSESFGGGAGEEAFSSFMVHEYAERFSAQGGIGLAEIIVRALSEDSR